MFGFGHGPELILILILGLIFLGPQKIPEVAQFLGKAVRELRQASSDLQKTFDVNELVNPAPPTPPPAPPVTDAVAAQPASTETILPPAEAAAKPKRARKRSDADANGSEPAKPRVRRRPSKETEEPVSLDVPA